MKTEVIAVTEENFPLLLEKATTLWKQGELVIFPTETVYGIGANVWDEKAVAKIFQAKGRPQDNPLIVHIAEMEQLKELALQIPAKGLALAKAFWPGPLTMIFPKNEKVPLGVTGGLDSVAVRMPSHPIAHALLQHSKLPIVAPSANLSGAPSPTTAEHCVADMDGKVPLILDGGACPVGVESTVLSLLSEDSPILLRPGAVTVAKIEEVVGSISISPAVLHMLENKEKALSPGMKYRHYAPKANVILVHGTRSQYVEFCNNVSEQQVWAMAFEEDLPYLKIPAKSYGHQNVPTEQASQLFALLRSFDEENAKTIYVHAPQQDGDSLAVYNRLLRAASFQERFLSE